ncbi:MAG: CaiB/BaiF CoA transferase family protein [Minwuia sp.]|uniref:CaiB/BaiF CoA transferase family protein n=1 Tax=Minwuia sp. TaxID=2493630 RepID=UPI003A8642E3
MIKPDTLKGIRVVEMSHMVMGPSCGMFLAMLGAEVIKVEPPEGDRTRFLTGMGTGFFPVFNRGKRSITLDLNTDEGMAAMHGLLATADVFLENFKHGSLAKRGLDAASLRQRYPKLIAVPHKGFANGPYRDRTALDEVVQMMTGLAYMTGPTGRPLRVGSSANDIMAGLFGAMGVMAALMDREKSGEGREIRVGLFENCLLLVAQHMVQFELEGTEAPPMPERDFSWPVYDIFDTADGKPLFVGAVTLGHWNDLCGLLGLTDLVGRDDLSTKMQQIEARSWTLPLIAEAIRRHTLSELETAFQPLGIPYAPIARPVEMYDDPHVRRPGGLLPSRYGEKRFNAPGLPLDYDSEPVGFHADVPDIGQDTEAVLGDLGLDPDAIARASGRNE